MIENLGFSLIVRKIILECVETPRYSIMMKDTYKGIFKSRRGIRQGDPLSPYLFIFMEEVFSRILKKGFQEERLIISFIRVVPHSSPIFFVPMTFLFYPIEIRDQ